MVIIFKLCCFANWLSSGTRAMVPSSFMISQITPAGFNLPNNLENVLACQAMFPVTSATEMAGQPGETYPTHGRNR